MMKRKMNLTRKSYPIRKYYLYYLSFIVILTSGIPWNNAEAIELLQKDIPKLTQVGPTNDNNGFPFWYKDSKGVKLELCLDAHDPLCGLVAEDFDPNQPIEFPTNYPGEAFYQLAETAMEGKIVEMMLLRPLLLKQHLTEEIQRRMTKLYLDVSALE